MIIESLAVAREEECFWIEIEFSEVAILRFPVPFEEVNYPSLDCFDGFIDYDSQDSSRLRMLISNSIRNFQEMEIALSSAIQV